MDYCQFLVRRDCQNQWGTPNSFKGLHVHTVMHAVLHMPIAEQSAAPSNVAATLLDTAEGFKLRFHGRTTMRSQSNHPGLPISLAGIEPCQFCIRQNGCNNYGTTCTGVQINRLLQCLVGGVNVALKAHLS